MHQHLHIASERRHDVDVEAGHLVQTVEHHRVLPREDGDRDRTMTVGDCIRCLFVLCWNSVEMKKGQHEPTRGLLR